MINKRLMVLFLPVLFVFSLAFASAATLYTTDIFGNAKTDFSPTEAVYIHGQGFLANSIISLQITRPDSNVDYGIAFSNNLGRFVYVYAPGLIPGIYSVYASDGTRTAEVEFTDAAIWTTRNDCGDSTQDANHYAIGDSVHINGDGFTAGNYSWEIKGKPGGASCDSNVVVASGIWAVNASGEFCFNAYTVQADDCGEYGVKFDVKGDNYRVEGGECEDDEECGESSSVLQCQGNDIYNYTETPACSDETCIIQNNTQFVQSCGEGISSLICVGNNITNITVSPGCAEGACFNTTIALTIQQCPTGNSTISYCEGNASITNVTTYLGCSSGSCENRTQMVEQTCLFGCLGGECQEEEEPECGNGIVEEGEQCEPPNTGTCDSQCQTISECEDDEDNDGVCDPEDECPDSKPGEIVDEDGCDIYQFCTIRSCGYDCLEADWFGDEQNTTRPRDCTVVIPLKNGVESQPICVPTVLECSAPVGSFN